MKIRLWGQRHACMLVSHGVPVELLYWLVLAVVVQQQAASTVVLLLQCLRFEASFTQQLLLPWYG